MPELIPVLRGRGYEGVGLQVRVQLASASRSGQAVIFDRRPV
jgi:hypothetical protein